MKNHSLQNAAQLLRTSEFAAFVNVFRTAFAKHDRVNLTGTGEAGRLCIRMERAWRKAVHTLMEKYPQAVPALEEQLDYFRHIDIGGEYSVITTPACLSQSNPFGRGMMRARGVASADRDVVVCIDPTGDTPSTLGSAHFALIHLAPMYMLTCAAPDVEKNRHTREVYTHPNCRILTGADLHVFEILCAVAVEASLWDILETAGIPNGFPGYEWFAAKLEALPSAADLAFAGKTLCADEYFLDALCFAAEHSQFQVKNPNHETAGAWERCFLRSPRCLSWPADFYQALGFTNQQIRSIPDISEKALMQIPIGKETLTDSNALMVDTLLDSYDLPETFMDIFQHITVNLLLKSLIN